MKRIISFCCILFLTLTSNAQVFNVDTLHYSGDPSNRINLVIMGDGYQSTEMVKFRSDAQSVADYFLTTPPFSYYSHFFNFFAIEVLSNESGNDHPQTASDESFTQPLSSVDNYLQTSFDNGVHRCVYSSQTGLVYNIANANVPQWDYVNVIINTNYYGGCAGGIAFTTMNSSSPEIFTHEFGHMFGGLADEYDYGSSGGTCTAGAVQNINVSQMTDTSLLVWKKWLTASTFPTPAGTECTSIGLYEGAEYCDTNWYRPKCDCKMRSLGVPYCEVCYEQFILTINSLVNHIDAFSPATSTFSVCHGEIKTFSADVINTTDSTIRIQWLVDNTIVHTSAPTYVFNSALFSNGIHQVKLVTYDTTSHVKKPLTTYSKLWTVTVNPNVTATITNSGPLTVCSNDAVVLRASPNGNYTYSWLRNNSPLANQSDSLLSVTTAGSYKLIMHSGSCVDTSSSIQVSVTAAPNVSAVVLGNDTICIGDSALIRATSNSSFSYQWLKNNLALTGENDSTIVAGSSGSYSVIVNDATCSDTSNIISLNVSPLPVVSITGLIDTVCKDWSAISLSGNPPGGTFSGNGVSGSLFDPNVAGPGMHSVNYTYSNSIGCENSDSADIFVDVCASVDEMERDYSFSVYPNPVSDGCQISYELNQSCDVAIRVFDVNGKLVRNLIDEKNQSGKNIVSMSTAEFANGIYNIEIKISQNIFYRKLIVIGR